jgi:hypothetical protein
VGATAVAGLLIAAGYGGAFLPGGAPAWAAWTMIIGIATLLVALMLLGALRGGDAARPLLLPLLAVYLILLGGFGAVLAFPPEAANGNLWLGLPRRAALVLYGVGLLPVLILPVAYARTFDSLTLRPEDLERIRAARDRREAGS